MVENTLLFNAYIPNIINKAPQTESIMAEYIWIDGSGINVRSKSRTLEKKSYSRVADLPEWNYDGSSTW